MLTAYEVGLINLANDGNHSLHLNSSDGSLCLFVVHYQNILWRVCYWPENTWTLII